MRLAASALVFLTLLTSRSNPIRGENGEAGDDQKGKVQYLIGPDKMSDQEGDDYPKHHQVSPGFQGVFFVHFKFFQDYFHVRICLS